MSGPNDKSPGDGPDRVRREHQDGATEHSAAEDFLAQISQLSARLLELSSQVALTTEHRLEIDAANVAVINLARAWAGEPEKLAAAQLDLFNRQGAVLRAAAADAAASSHSSEASWADGAFAGLIREMFAATAKWAEGLAVEAPGLTDVQRRRIAFFVRQALAAMSPANSLATNPRALKRLVETNGASVARGLAYLEQDLRDGGGRPAVRQADAEAFTLGVNLAATSGEIVLRNELMELIRYLPSTTNVRSRPILILPPWINKYYVLDLTHANSMAAWLRDQGFTVYMISWRSADDLIADFGWDEYLRLGALAALDWISGAHRGKTNVAGYCVGGALSCILAAKLAAAGDSRIASLTLLAAQTDFSEPGDLGLFMDEESLPAIASMVADNGGVMPGEAMRDAFNLLRPEELIWRYVEERYLLGEPPRTFDLLFWNSDQTNLPGRLHLESVKRLYCDNALAAGRFEIDGEMINLRSITAPVFLHAARKDHISPFRSVFKGMRLFGGPVDFLLADLGHIAGVVNPPAAKKYRYWTAPQNASGPPHGANSRDVDVWLRDAVEHPGSWWPVWSEWLQRHSGALQAPPRPIANANKAPGDYVRETLASIRARREPIGLSPPEGQGRH